MKISLFFPGIPRPKQAMRTSVVYNRKTKEPVIYRDKNSGKRKVLTQNYQDPDIVQYEHSIKLMAKEQLPPGFNPTDRPIAIRRLIYCFPPIKSLKIAQKQAIEQGKFVIKATKPDLTDNLSKAVFDALQGILYMNDSQIYSMGEAFKVYGAQPGITLELEILEPGHDMILHYPTQESVELKIVRELGDDMPF